MTHPALGRGQMIKRGCSFVLYLNQEWSEADAGHLRVYDSHAADAAHIDVAPTAATLVVFRSDEVMHEVRATSAERFCVIGWFNRIMTSHEQAADDVWPAHAAAAAGLLTPPPPRLQPNAQGAAADIAGEPTRCSEE